MLLLVLACTGAPADDTGADTDTADTGAGDTDTGDTDSAVDTDTGGDTDTDTDTTDTDTTDTDTGGDTDTDTGGDTDTDTGGDTDTAATDPDAHVDAVARAVLTGGGDGCVILHPEVVDADGDGGSDLVVECASGEVLLVAADGSGTVALPDAAVGSVVLGRDEVYGGAGELTGDGVADLVVARDTWDAEGTSAEVTMARIPGPWARGRTTGDADLTDASTGEIYGTAANVVGDLDGDGIDEALYAPGSWFASNVQFFPEGGSTGADLGVRGYNSMVALAGVGDLDADGLPDLVTVDMGVLCLWAGPFDTLRTERDADAWLRLTEGTSTEVRPAGDLDGDGAPDLLVRDDDQLVVLRGPLASGVAHTDVAWLRTDGPVSAGAVAELDGDGTPELLVGVEGADHDGDVYAGVVYVHDDLGAGGVRGATDAVRTVHGSAGAGLGTSLVTLPDLDGDGADDVAVGALEAIYVLGGL